MRAAGTGPGMFRNGNANGNFTLGKYKIPMVDLLYCCKMGGTVADFEAAAELLESLGVEFSSAEDREAQTVYHTVYAESEEQGRENFAVLKRAVVEWREFGVDLTDPEYFELPREDWSEVWKKYFPVLPVTERLVVKPSWLEYEAKPGQVILELDPGMSFGTGQHATTSFCLHAIDQLAGKPGVKSLLDAGCGSGILALAAAKLGFAPIDAFDFDPDAVRIAAENLALNGILPSLVAPFVADAKDYPGRAGGYDLVAANILGHLLKEYRENIARWVRPGGYLALAGILNTEFDGVAAVFIPLGFAEVERRSEKEWTSGLFRKQ